MLKRIISELRRVLKMDGALILTINCYNKACKIWRYIIELLNIGDKAHTYSFTVNDVFMQLKGQEFIITNCLLRLGTLGEVSKAWNIEWRFEEK